MKVNLKYFFPILLISFSCSQNAIAQSVFKADLLDSIVAHEQIHRQLQQEQISLAASDNYDMQYARIEVAPSQNTRFISGKILYKYKLLKSSSSIELDASDDLVISSVKWHGQNIVYTHSNDILTIAFPSAQNPQEDSLQIIYSGIPNETGLGSYNEDKHGSDSVKVIWTLSQPYGARDWMPCKMTLSDKVDSFDMFIEVDSGFTAISNGLQISATSISNSKSVFHWAEHYPIASYLIAFAVTNYDTFNLSVDIANGLMPLHFYTFPESKSDWKGEANNVVNCMSLFDSLFSGYPFSRDHYGETQFIWGGGMEHQTNSFMYNVWFELVAHEMGHQWFGDNITCGSWQDIWLNEGFATYLSGLAYENIQPIYWKAFLQTIGKRAVSLDKGTVYVDDTNSVSRIFSGALSYSKGAYVLHMLRWKIGDSLFYSALNNYLKDTKLNFGFATTADLQRNIEATIGKPINDFFEKWVYGSGYPTYTALWSQSNGKLKMKLLQSTSDPESVDFFDLKVELLLVGQNIDTVLLLNHSFSGEEFIIDINQEVDSVFIDPNLWILSKNNKSIRLPNIDDSSDFFLFPNPASQAIHLVIYPGSANLNSVKIISMEGKVVATQQITNPYETLTLNTENLQKGVYTYALYHDGKYISGRRFVKR